MPQPGFSENSGMIETFFSSGILDSPRAFLAAFLVGLGFGFILERAGLGSSRRLAGVFYLTDMTVVKVMFSALITAMLGLQYLMALGWLIPEQLFFMPTMYGAQFLGGLIFGVGFVMAGWCPGTAAVGLASGKLDAAVFLGGVVGGSILFNELYPIMAPLHSWGGRGVVFIYQTLGMSSITFVLLFTLAAVAVFWLVDFLERKKTREDPQEDTTFLKSFSLALVILAVGLIFTPGVARTPGVAGGEGQLLRQVEGGHDHMEPEELADRLSRGEPGLVVVDVRSAEEFQAFHLRGAVNVSLAQLAKFLAPHKNTGIIVLYSNGMTHPAQARDSLYRQGFRNVFILTDGLKGFLERCLMPVSLRSEPVLPQTAARINTWRAFFLSQGKEPQAGPASAPAAAAHPSQ
jgi:rhodanese-related sulfurtransferase/uncharacterized membrane protein YedE/YeeE